MSVNMKVLSQMSAVDFLNNLQLPVFIKDKDSRFIYANNAYRDFFSLSSDLDIEGKYHCDFLEAAAPYEEEIQFHDKKIMNREMQSSAIEVHEIKGEWKAWHTHKQPLYHYQSVEGVVTVITPARYIDDLIFTKNDEVDTTILLSPPTDLFTKREWDVLYFRVHQYSAVDIAEVLGVKVRTVREVIKRVMGKLRVHNQEDLIAFCRVKGWHRYIPPHLIIRHRELEIFSLNKSYNNSK